MIIWKQNDTSQLQLHTLTVDCYQRLVHATQRLIAWTWKTRRTRRTIPWKVGKRWKGNVGHPISYRQMNKDKSFADGGGLCSPGRWSPKDGAGILDNSAAWMDQLALKLRTFVIKNVPDLKHATFRLATGHIMLESPFSEEAMEKLREEWSSLLGGAGSLRVTPYQPLCLFVLAQTWRRMGDEDHAIISEVITTWLVAGWGWKTGFPPHPWFSGRRRRRLESSVSSGAVQLPICTWIQRHHPGLIWRRRRRMVGVDVPPGWVRRRGEGLGTSWGLPFFPPMPHCSRQLRSYPYSLGSKIRLLCRMRSKQETTKPAQNNQNRKTNSKSSRQVNETWSETVKRIANALSPSYDLVQKVAPLANIQSIHPCSPHSHSCIDHFSHSI